MDKKGRHRVRAEDHLDKSVHGIKNNQKIEKATIIIINSQRISRMKIKIRLTKSQNVGKRSIKYK